MKPDLEQALWNRIKQRVSPRDAIAEMLNQGLIQSEKQAHRTLEKWGRQRRYEYGVCLDLGWLLAEDGKPL